MLEKIARTPVSQIATHLPITIPEDATVVEAVMALKRARRGAIVVTDPQGRAVGLFTERVALFELDPTCKEWHLEPVSSVMLPAEVSISIHDTVANAIEKLREHGLRHIPAVDDRGRAIGIISSRDLLAFLAEHFPRAFMNLPPRRAPGSKPGWGDL